jgi:histone-lysine N-methyltransferase SETMAR
LSDEQKNARVQICETLLARYRNESDTFLHRIVTVDETWCHHYMPESKRASKEWRGKDEECPVKAKTQPSTGKVMAMVSWDYKGVLHINFLHYQKTISAVYYCDLLEKVRAACRSKRRSFSIRDVLLLHDNARPHTAALAQKKLAELYWTALEHPPYSPDLSLCDFFLFGPLKEVLGWERFNSNQQVKQFVCNWLKTRPSSFYDTGMKNLPLRWQKCIHKAGNYVEK